MVTFGAILLLVNAVYNIIVWPQFWNRVVADPRSVGENGKRTYFYRVHAVLISIALAIAAASGIAGIMLLLTNR